MEVYGIDDATCMDGQYDVEVDKDFRVIVITRGEREPVLAAAA
jgi:hypothetical protein